jgi:tetratricopeptide (TPR) repeat protein
LTALQLTEEAIVVDRGLNNARGVANHLYNMAAYLLALERYDEARAFGRQAVTMARDLQVAVLTALSLEHLAAVAALQNDEGRAGPDNRLRAARLLGYVDARLTELDVPREYAQQRESDKIVAVLRNAFGEDGLATVMEEGRGWSEDGAVAEAMLI